MKLCSPLLLLGAVIAFINLFSFLQASGQGFGLYPDLRTVIPQQLQIQNTQQREMLRFSNGIANTGAGDLRMRAEFPTTNVNQPQLAIQEILDASRNVVSSSVVSQFQYHPEHNHWHINDVALFEVRAGSPTGVVFGTTSVKVTFCLIDWYKMEGNSNTPGRTYSECNGTYQGISPGWVDHNLVVRDEVSANLTHRNPLNRSPVPPPCRRFL